MSQRRLVQLDRLPRGADRNHFVIPGDLEGIIRKLGRAEFESRVVVDVVVEFTRAETKRRDDLARQEQKSPASGELT